MLEYQIKAKEIFMYVSNLSTCLFFQQDFKILLLNKKNRQPPLLSKLL